MSWYIEFSIPGRNERLKLSEMLEVRGYSDDIFYDAGGWQDTELNLRLPHLRFDNYDDAIAFALAYGGKCSTVPPQVERIKNIG